jgi:hypothetical protein
MNMETEAEIYVTTDLSLAAFLVAKGHTLVGITGPKNGRQFSFESTARNDAPAFFLNGPVGARDFASALRQLKSAIHTL